MKRRFAVCLAVCLSGCAGSPPPTPTVAATPRPPSPPAMVAAPALATATPVVTLAPEPSVPAAKTETGFAAPAFQSGQSFASYVSQSLAVIDAASSPRSASGLALDWWSMESDLRRETERAVASQTGKSTSYAISADLMEGLAEVADARARSLDGRMSAREYGIVRPGRERSLNLLASQLDNRLGTTTSQEREGRNTLGALKKGMN